MTEKSDYSIKGQAYYYSSQQQGIDRRTKELVIARCLPFVCGPHVLDLGYVDGSWTDRLLESQYSVDIVEGAEHHIAQARSKYAQHPAVRIYHAFFQEFRPDRQYDAIIAGDVLRYIPEPIDFLARLRHWLKSEGVLVVTVPNSGSMHRRIGALMGLEPHYAAANARDVEVGNLRSYDRYHLRHELRQAGLSIVELRGCFLKPLSSAQMADWSDDLLRALLELGDELEDYAWFLYAICRRAVSATDGDG